MTVPACMLYNQRDLDNDVHTLISTTLKLYVEALLARRSGFKKSTVK